MPKSVVVIGVDQSYQRTGVSIAKDGELLYVSSINYEGLKTKSEKRDMTRIDVQKLCRYCCNEFDYAEFNLVLERTRQFSDGFISIPYIKAMGALNASVIDVAKNYGFECWSIDTRAWKSGVVGSSKPLDNPYGVNPKKWRTILWFINEHSNMKKQIMVPASKRVKKGVLTTKSGKRFLVNDDACDSAGIALSWFKCSADKFMGEE